MDYSLRKIRAVNRMNSSFPDRCSFSYLKFTKICHLYNESKYTYEQQEHVRVKNHNRSIALERSVLKYWDLKQVFSLFGKELFIRFTASAFHKLPSIYVFSYFPFGFEGRMWDLIVSVPDHCLPFYFTGSQPRPQLLLYDKNNE